MRHIFLFLISCCIALQSYATVVVDGIYYNLNYNTNTASVAQSSNKSYTGDISIAEKIMYEDVEYLVTSLEDYSFYCCDGVTSVTIPSSVTKIGQCAFNGCRNIQKIFIPSSVKSIGEYCAGNVDVYIEDLTAWCNISFPDTYKSPFSNWRLFLNNEEITRLEIPETINYVRCNSFAGCTSIREVTLSSSIKSLENYAFYKCTEMEKINLNEGLTYLGQYCLCGCRNITDIVLPNTINRLDIGALQNICIKSITIPSSVSYIENGCFLNSDLLEEIIFEDGTNSISIGTGQYSDKPQFQGCTLKSLYLGRDIKKKANSLSLLSPFKGQQDLTDVTIGNCVTEIPTGCFEGCTSLVNISIPDNVQTIGAYAFNGCENLPIENSIRYADTYAIEIVDNTQESYELKENTRFLNSYLFSGCRNMTSIDLPANIESIGDGLFYGCENLAKIDIPGKVKSIGSSAFSGCKSLTELFIPKSVRFIYYGAFDYCTSLSNLTIEDSEEQIGLDNSNHKGMFRDSPLQEVYIGRGMGTTYYDGTYDHYPFSNQKQLKKLTFGETCKNIGDRYFYDCSGLEQICVPWQSPSEINYTTFNQTTYKNCTLKIPANSTSVYSRTNYWNMFANIEEYDTNAIPSINIGEKKNVIYDLQGLPVKKIEKRGIYIINNKTVVF